MKKFTYPAVVYYDEDNKLYVLTINELGLVAEGETVEEAHAFLDQYLSQYLYTAIAFGIDIPEPYKYDEVLNKNSNHNIMLINSQIDEKKIKNYA